MNILAIFLIEMFKKYFESTAVTSNESSYTYKEILEKSYSLANRLNHLSKERTKIALIANNSIEWIIVFIAVILSDHKLVLISRNLSIKKVKRSISDSKASIIITDLPLHKRDFSYIYCVIDIKTIEYKKSIVLDRNMLHIEENLIVYTPRRLEGISIPYKKILSVLSELDKKEIFNTSTEYVAYQEFTYNYVLTLLLPLTEGVEIIIPKHVFNTFTLSFHSEKVVILTAHQFEELWRESICPSSNSLMRVLSELKLSRIRNWMIKRNLKLLFPNIETLIILNSELNIQIETILKKIKFPFTITYGIIENCGISTYSKPKEFVFGSCGKMLQSTVIDSVDDRFEVDTNYNFFFKCREEEIITTKFGFTITRDVEKILKNLPLVKDCVFIKWYDDLILIVNIDFNHIDSKNISLEEVYKILEDCRLQINSRVHTFENISKILVDFSEFKRDAYGRILREYYTISEK